MFSFVLNLDSHNFTGPCSYIGGFFIGSGDGDGSFDIDVSISTVSTFASTDFDSTGPSGVTLHCAAYIDLENIDVGIGWLNALVIPFLTSTLEEVLEPAVCAVVESLESALDELILGINDALDEYTDPLPHEVTDSLYPEKKFMNTTSASFLNFKPLSSLFELGSKPLEMVVTWLNKIIFGDNGVLNIPLLFPLSEGIDLVEIRIIGFNNYTYDALSLIGKHTFETTYVQDYVGLEIELAVRDNNNMTDLVIVETGINDLAIDFAMMVVIEDLLTIDVLFSGLNNVIDCISHSLYALEVASFSVNAGSFNGLQISGLSQYAGPQEMINEITNTVFYMYDNLLINVVNSLFQATATGAINNVIAPLLPTCVEEFAGRTVYIAVDSACWKIELFEGGTLSRDTSNPDCSNEEHVSNIIMSKYQFSDKNSAYFSEGDSPIDWSGKIEFKEDPMLPSPDVKTISISNVTNTFEVLITFPTCTAPCST
jgi:hypothetical protein